MACVGYLLAGLPPRPQGTRRNRLRSAYDTFFVPVRAALHTTRLCTGYARLRKAVCDVAHKALSQTFATNANVWGHSALALVV